jgi:DNA polymerase-1
VSTRPSGGAGSLFVIDANNFMFRAFHGLPPLSAPDGTPVNAVHGYMRMLQAMRKEFAPQFIIAVFDARGPGWRHDIFPEYKANRPPAPEDLRPQIPLVRDATKALGIPWCELERYEADDLIAAYAERGQAAGYEVVVVSSDKDLMQLVDEPGEGRHPIRLWDTMKNRLVGPERVQEKYGVAPDRLADLLALAGDSTDNVPGVQGIGPKTAATLLAEWGSLEGILENADKVKQKKRRERLIEFADDARMSRALVALRTDFDLPIKIEELEDHGPKLDELEAFCTPLGLRSNLAGAVSGGRSGTGTRVSAPPAGELFEPLPGVQIDPANTRSVYRDDQALLESHVEAARKAGSFGFHVEGSGEDAMRSDLVGLALHVPEATPATLYVPVGHRSLGQDTAAQFDVETLWPILRPLFEDVGAAAYAHAHKAQSILLDRKGLEVGAVRADPMLASYTLDAARSSHTIESLGTDLLAHDAIKRESVVGKGKKQVGFDMVDILAAAPYVGERAELALILGRHLESLIERSGEDTKKLFEKVEMPLATVLRRLERRGILLDGAVLREQADALGASISEIRKAIEEDAGYSINPESPQQLQKLLFEDRGLPAKKKTKTGYSTDAQVLEELSLYDPIVKLILEHRSLTKLKGTYLDTLPTLVNAETGRLHSHFRQAVAQTGRLSSENPNLQNIPIRTRQGRQIRRGFVAPEGRLLVTLDYSQIELRVLAHLSGDPSLSAAFREGADVHRRTAAEVFDVSEDEVSGDQRRIAKAVNFGVIYGQSAFGLARTLGIPQGRAGKYIKNYFKKIPGVDAYMTELVQVAKRKGYAQTILGRRRRIPELSMRGAAKAYGERIARNTPIQGSAADILKVAMIDVEQRLEKLDWAEMLLTVHDELIFECDEARAEELIAVVRPAMEEAVKLDVPLEVESGSGANWEAAKT